MASAVARFGPFEVVSRIGFGGMGEVFRARYAGEGGAPEIALKLIRPEHATDLRFRQMFLAEARVGAVLDHPNIVAMVDWGDVDGVLYLASELVDGISLHRLLSTPPRLPLELGAYVLGSVLDALGYAHALRGDGGKALGLVHRDVSPANVLLSRAGAVKLTDFGVSKVAGAPQTLTGELKGKPAFMAPEQLSGRDVVDGRADLFAVGVMLHMLVLERPPFSDVGSWLAAGARLDVSGPFADLITLALAPDAEHRFGSAAEFADALRRAIRVGEGAAAELGRRVRELVPGERPLTDMERLIMSELEPSQLIYAPDPSTGQLFVVGAGLRTPAPERAFDESGPTHTKTFGGGGGDGPELTPTPSDFDTHTNIIARDPPPRMSPPPPRLPLSLLLTPTPTPMAGPDSLPTPPPLPAADSLPTPAPLRMTDSLPTPTPTPIMQLGSDPLPLDPRRPRRRLFPILALLAALVVASIVAVVIAASSGGREEVALGPPPPPKNEAPPPAPNEQPPVAAAPSPPANVPAPPADVPAPPEPAPPVQEQAQAPAPSEPTPSPRDPSEPPPARAKPRPPRPAKEPAVGFLTLDTEPWAVVYLGNRELGTTPFLRVPVPAGRQLLTFDLGGSGRRVRRPVDIPAGGVRRLALQLR